MLRWKILDEKGDDDAAKKKGHQTWSGPCQHHRLKASTVMTRRALHRGVPMRFGPKEVKRRGQRQQRDKYVGGDLYGSEVIIPQRYEHHVNASRDAHDREQDSRKFAHGWWFYNWTKVLRRMGLSRRRWAKVIGQTLLQAGESLGCDIPKLADDCGRRNGGEQSQTNQRVNLQPALLEIRIGGQNEIVKANDFVVNFRTNPTNQEVLVWRHH